MRERPGHPSQWEGFRGLFYTPALFSLLRPSLRSRDRFPRQRCRCSRIRCIRCRRHILRTCSYSSQSKDSGCTAGRIRRIWRRPTVRRFRSGRIRRRWDRLPVHVRPGMRLHPAWTRPARLCPEIFHQACLPDAAQTQTVLIAHSKAAGCRKHLFHHHDRKSGCIPGGNEDRSECR